MRTYDSKLIDLYEFLTSIGYGMEMKRLEPFIIKMSLGVLTDCFIEICVGEKGTDYKKTGYVFSFSSISNTMEEMFESVLKVIKKDFI
jgi:hypothetical protein